MTENLIQASEIASQPGLTNQQILIIGITALFSCIVAMGTYIGRLHQKHTKDHTQNVEKVTVAMVNSTHAIENNTRIVDKVFDYITKATVK